MRILTFLRPLLERRSAPVWIAIFAALLALPSLFGGFAADDHFLRMVVQQYPGMAELENGRAIDTFVFADGSVDRNKAFMNRGLIPWWSTPTARLAFWRPLASLTHYIDFEIFGDTAWPMHLQNLLWYVLLGFAAAALYTRMIAPRWIAILALFLYMVDDAHAMPVGWIANRNGIMAVFFGVLTILMHDRWRRDGAIHAMPAALSVFAVGLLCGEATLAVCGYLFAHALFLDRGGWFRGLLSLIPYGLVIIPWRIAYQIMEYGATGSGMYLDPVRETGLFAKALIARMPLLLNAQFGYPPSTLTVWAPPAWQMLHLIIAIEILLFILWVLIPMLRRSAVARFWALGMVIAILPVCATFPMDRLLFFAGIGAMGLIAQFLGGMVEQHHWVPTRRGWQGRARILFYAWIVLHIIISPISMPVRSLTMYGAGETLHRSVGSLPTDERVPEDNFVIITTPSDFDAWHIPIIRSSLRQPVPKHTLAFTVGPATTEIRRLDERTLEVRPESGFIPHPYGRMFRGWSYPFRAGQEIDLEYVTITVTQITNDDRPRVAEFRFDAPLDAPQQRYFVYEDGEYVPWTPPAVGESELIPGSFMFGLGARAAASGPEAGDSETAALP